MENGGGSSVTLSKQFPLAGERKNIGQRRELAKGKALF
jgi:hypothetical protein